MLRMNVDTASELLLIIRTFLGRAYNGELLDSTNRLKERKIRVQRKKLTKIVDSLGIKEDFGNFRSLDSWIYFLNFIEDPISEALLSQNAANIYVNITSTIDAELYKGRFKNVPAVFSSASSIEGTTIFLHGSMADHTYTPFSDIDDFVVVHKKAWESTEIFLKNIKTLSHVSRKFQEVDPFQHHGHWVISEFDTFLYDQSYCPLVVLEHAALVVGQGNLDFRVSNTVEGFLKNAVATIKAIELRMLRIRQKHYIKLFELKCLVGEILLLPAYIFQYKGILISKPDAIRRSEELFSERSLSVIDFASDIRNDFGDFLDKNREMITIGCAFSDVFARERSQAERIQRLMSPRISESTLESYLNEFHKSVDTFVLDAKSAIGTGKP
ncbi:hypothetical protein [cf. Phormidesmis sp. LEGE 11477]|uniref:hypothetical protein n=1 Tax=cf. Phormidesmis sp. LEGE 11477 TaxID=1828680 RepID=UPI00187E5959|nr:hypothetical protein [cf. Phormidesmis sp. LEGE 11477]MBE9063610.1 hypothetical protein [cf. Phormidesmis sp. LEGE 11477]